MLSPVGEEFTDRCLLVVGRFTPVVTNIAAVEDGNLKLVRSEIRATTAVSPSDREINCGLKKTPETILDIARDPEPTRGLPAPPEPLLLDIAPDPLERVNLTARREETAARLLGTLEA